MSQEINLFEEEVETSTIKKSSTSLEKYTQTSFPGMIEKVEEMHQKDIREKMLLSQVKRLVEALFFASNEPLSFNKIREVTDQLHPVKPRQLKDFIHELQSEYLSEQRGFRLEEIGEGYLLRTCEEFSPYLDQLFRNKRGERLSQAAAEVLAIIAYRQPITRPQIEGIRGVDSSGVIVSLLERNLIAAVGKLEAPGRPTLFGITQEFLTHFGLKDLKELPAIEL